jgi:two-component system, sensor histidine kinase and response regulator
LPTSWNLLSVLSYAKRSGSFLLSIFDQRMSGQHGKRLAGVVLAFSLAVTYYLWQSVQQNALRIQQLEFNGHVQEVTGSIQNRMNAYEQVMRGIDGLFSHSDTPVSRREFHEHIERLQLQQEYPGIQAIRFAPLIYDAARHVAAMRSESAFADYKIWPAGQRDSYAPVTYIEPFDPRNLQVYGYDMLSDLEFPRSGDSAPGQRRKAAEQSRDSGEFAISGKIRLLFEQEQYLQQGFVMFLPVYKHNAPHQTLAQRRENLSGWIISAFRMDDLMQGILGQNTDIDVEIYDGEAADDKSMMYDSHPGILHQNPQFKNSRPVKIAGHKWILYFHSLPEFENKVDLNQSRIIASYGIALSLLLALITWLIINARARALQAAEALKRSSRKNEILLRTASDGIYIFDLEGRVLQVNDAFSQMIGYTKQELLTMNVAQWNVQWTQQELLKRINTLGANNPTLETRHRRRDGDIIEVEIGASRVVIDDQPVIYCSAREITERKKTDAAFHTLAGTAVSSVGASFFQETISSLCKLLDADCFMVGRLVDNKHVQALYMQLDGSMVEHYEYELPGTPCENATHAGYIEYPENVCQLFPADRELADMHAVAYIGVPTRDNEGRVNGILCGIFRHKLVPQAMRKEVLEIVAARAGAEIERQQAESALRVSEERWSFALEGAGEGVWDWNMQSGLIVYSKRYKEMLGFPEDSDWNHLDDWSERVNPDDLRHAMMDLEKYLDGKAPSYIVDYRMLCQDGNWKWVSARGMVVSRAEDGRPLRMIGTHTDITERKQAAEAIRISEARLRMLLDSAAEAIYGIDVNGICTFCNPSCVKMLRYSHADELIGKNMHALIHFKYPDGTPYPVDECRIYQAFLNGLETHVENEVFWRADGTSFPVHHNEVVGAVVTFMDISERMAANEKLLKLSKAVENSPASVIITDTDGTIEYVNPRFSEVTGYSAAEALGQNPRILKSGMLAPKFYEKMWNTILSGEVWQGELHNRKKNGESYFEAVTISPIRDEKGNTTHFVAVKENITERKHTEQELKKSTAAAEAANRAKSDFLANMSHEIRTPMNAIIGFSHLCLQSDLTTTQRDYLDKVYRSANSLLGILNDILDFSKVEAGKLEVEKTLFHLDSVLSGVAAIASFRAEEKGLELQFNCGREIPYTLLGDPLRLGQVLNNLVSNAIKFTKTGEVTVQVKVESLADENIVLGFSVTDSGIGLSQEQIGKLFQSFSQADASITRKYGGTGLGLAISKRLVELMNGTMWVESIPGKGSTFAFNLPLSCLPESRTIPDLSGRRMLVVDANEMARRLITSYLQSFHIQIDAASNNSAGLEMIKQAEASGRPYGEVLLDCDLPGINGLGMVRQIRQELQLAHRPRIIYLLSPRHNETLKNAGNNELPDTVLNKPVTASLLFDAIMTIDAGQGSNPIPVPVPQDNRVDLNGLHVLLVEDNEFNQQLATALLTRARIKVRLARDGVEAVEAVHQEKFDAVLMDMQMPRMDGLEATRQIRANPAYDGLPIIAMTANAMSGDRELCLAAGMNDYIAKPVNIGRLYAILARWTNRAITPPASDMSAPVPATNPKILDAEKAISGMGDIEIYLIVLDKFTSNQGGTVLSIQEALAANDLKTAERLAHTLKGIAATIGAVTLAESARILQFAIRNEEAGNYQRCIDAVANDLSQVIVSVESYLSVHAPNSDTDPQAPDPARIILLMEQLSTQLSAFDSDAGDTMHQINQQLNGSPQAQRYAQLTRYINDYDYENALTELNNRGQTPVLNNRGQTPVL